MQRLATGFSRAPTAAAAAEELAAGVESELGTATEVGGGLLLATAAAGDQGAGIGRALADRWPEAHFGGTSFEGLLAEGRSWHGEPAFVLIAWPEGPEEPVPMLVPPAARRREPDAEDAAERLAAEIHAALGPMASDPRDLLLLFPDALATGDLEAWLPEALREIGQPAVAGAAASGVDGGPCSAWLGEVTVPGASLGLILPGTRDPGVQGWASEAIRTAGASRAASPWLQVTAGRGRWVDALDDEPALDWVRRQLGLDAGEPVEPYLDRLLVRLSDATEAPEPVPGACPDGDVGGAGGARAADRYFERFVVGVDDDRGAISLPGPVRRGAHLAFALPDAAHARTSLRSAVAALPKTALLLQLACRARDATLHGDADLETALVASAAPDRETVGTLGPFQLGPGHAGRPRLLVHTTVLAALGRD